MTRTTLDIPTELLRDARLLLTLRPSGPQTLKGLVMKLLQEQIDQNAPDLERLREIQKKAELPSRRSTK